MKVYTLHDRFGYKVDTFRRPKVKSVPTEPIEAGIPGFFDMEWYDFSTMPLSWKIAFWNYWLGYGLDFLGLRPAVAVSLVQDKILAAVAAAKISGYFFLGAIIALYVGSVIVYWLIDPERISDHWEQEGARRYLLRYNEFVWLAGIARIDGQGNPVYRICDEAGSIIAYEDRNIYRHNHLMDWWSTDALWVQLLKFPGRYETFRWTDTFVNYVGMSTRVGATEFALQKGYTDDFADGFDPLYEFPLDSVCEHWRDYIDLV